MAHPEAAAPSAPVGAVRLDADNPWPGLLSFTEDNRAFFHGRTQDVAALMRLIRRDTLTVLFGRSGYGKTSLLQAGLFPALRAEDFLPIKVRLDFSPGAPPLADQVARRLRATFADEGIDAPPPDAASLWAYFHDTRTEFWSRRHHLLTPVLVFDQFEEILTLGATTRRDEADALLTQIADLAESRPTAEVRAAIERGERDAGEWRLGDAPVKLVLSFREDYLAQFEALRRRMPSIMTGRMRVLPMTVQQGLEAVLASGGHLVDASVAREIVAFVAGRGADDVAGRGSDDVAGRGADDVSATGGDPHDGAAEVEPALLSVVCHELNRRRQAAGLARISRALLDVAHDAIIADFYRQSVAGAPDALRRLIEDELVTLDGHRKSFPLPDALGRPGMREADIAALVASRILRIDDRFGSRHLELTHDLLTGVVRAARAERRDAEAAAAAAARQAAQRRRALRLGAAALGVLIFVGAVAAGFAVLWQRERLALARVEAATAVADHRRRDAIAEREALIGELGQVLSIASDQFRTLPGAAQPLRDLGDSLEDFLHRFRVQVASSTLASDETSVVRLSFAARMLAAQLDTVLGRLTAAQADLAAARQALDSLSRMEGGAPQPRLAAQYWLRTAAVWRAAGEEGPAAEAFAQAAEAVRAALAARPEEMAEPRARLTVALVTALAGGAEAAMPSPPWAPTPANRAALDRAAHLNAAAAAAAARAPDLPGLRRDRAEIALCAGDILAARGDLKAADARYAEALAIYEALAREAGPSPVARLRQNLVRYHRALARLAALAPPASGSGAPYADVLGLLAQAYGAYNKASVEDPSNMYWLSQAASIAETYGDVQRAAGSDEAAIAFYADAVRDRRTLLAMDPVIAAWRTRLGVALAKQAEAAVAAGDTEAARKALEEARGVIAAGANPDRAALARLGARLAALPPGAPATPVRGTIEPAPADHPR